MKMKKHLQLFLLILTIITTACSNSNPVITIETSLGDISVELYLKDAPVTAANFLRYVDNGLFDSTCFYRVVKTENQPCDSIRIDVIQGGRYNDECEFYPSISHETTKETGIRHLDGVISMARLDPGTATSEFFICVGNQPELDFGGRRNPDGQGFAAFGKVIGGMDVVKMIHNLDAPEQFLSPTVSIKKVYKSKK